MHTLDVINYCTIQKNGKGAEGHKVSFFQHKIYDSTVTIIIINSTN